jgi:hypothetical protein
VFIKPAAAGTRVEIMTEGLDWSGGDVGVPPVLKKPGNPPSAADAEGEAQKAIKEAEKGLPK